MDILAQLEDAQNELVRALQLLDEPAAGDAAAAGAADEARQAAAAAGRTPEEDRQFKLKVLEQLKKLRDTLSEDEQHAQVALKERDMEIARLRRQLEELGQHHILPPLAYKYEPITPPSSAYSGPLKLPAQDTYDWGYRPADADLPYADVHNASEELKHVVVTYMLDGSDKYTPMTVNAIESLYRHSPDVNIGIVTQDIDMARLHLSHIPGNFHFVPTTMHFENWNPTQFKLDILQFSGLFDTIVWMDSDTYVYRDLRPFLLNFHRSQKPFALMPDLVMHDPAFKSRWSGDKSRVFVAQASMMGFKAGPMKQLFVRWEEKWREWIVPFPFANYKDPMPDFAGSAFCIEQYALAMALEELMQDAANDIFQIGREQVFLQLLDDGTLDVFAVPFNFAQGIPGLSGVGSYGSARVMTLSMSAGFGTSARITYQGSLQSSYGYSTSSGGIVLPGTATPYHMIDNLANAVLHLYNTHYEVVFNLVQQRSEDLLSKIRH